MVAAVLVTRPSVHRTSSGSLAASLRRSALGYCRICLEFLALIGLIDEQVASTEADAVSVGLRAFECALVCWGGALPSDHRSDDSRRTRCFLD
jgi:hypothetical protein